MHRQAPRAAGLSGDVRIRIHAHGSLIRLGNACVASRYAILYHLMWGRTNASRMTSYQAFFAILSQHVTGGI